MADSVDLRCSESPSFLGSGGIGEYSGSEAPPLGAAEQWVLSEGPEEEEEYFQMQVAKETDFVKLLPWDDDLRAARLEAVNWILDVSSLSLCHLSAFGSCSSPTRWLMHGLVFLIRI